MAVTLAGTAIMVSGSLGSGNVGGDLLGLGMALSFACGAILIRRHPELPMAAAAALSNALVCLGTAAMARPADVHARGPAHPRRRGHADRAAGDGAGTALGVAGGGRAAERAHADRRRADDVRARRARGRGPGPATRAARPPGGPAGSGAER
jgi:hypothetical protein